MKQLLVEINRSAIEKPVVTIFPHEFGLLELMYGEGRVTVLENPKDLKGKKFQKEREGIKYRGSAVPDIPLILAEEYDRLRAKWGQIKSDDGNRGKPWVEQTFGLPRERGIERWYAAHPEYVLDSPDDEDDDESEVEEQPRLQPRRPGRPRKVAIEASA